MPDDRLELRRPTDDRTVTMPGNDPWRDWAPQPGKRPSMVTLHNLNQWAKGQTRTFGGETYSDEALAALLCARTFPDWRPWDEDEGLPG